MTEHLTTRQIENFRQRTLKPAELLALDDHLAECAECRRQMREATGSQSAVLILQQNLRGAAAQPGLWRRIADVFSPTALGLAGATALLILALILALQDWEGKRDDIVSRSSPSPAPAAEPSVIPSPEILLAVNDGGDGGGQVKLDARGNLSGLDALSPADRQRVISALQTLKVETLPEPPELRASSGALMGRSVDEAFMLLSPLGEIVLSNQPTLRWKPLRGAESYTATVTDVRDNYSEVAACTTTAETQCQIDRPLKRGRIYAWLVTARKDGKEIKAPSAESSEAKFKVLEQVKTDELSRARNMYGKSHLTMGLLYAQAGLLDEAEGEFKDLVADNPQSPIAGTLLSDLQTKKSAHQKPSPTTTKPAQ